MSVPDKSPQTSRRTSELLATMPPWVSVALTFLGAVATASLFYSLSPWLLYGALGVALVIAASIWILETDEATARRLVKTSIGNFVLRHVSQVSGARMPSPQAIVLDAAAFTRVEKELTDAFPGQGETIRTLVGAVKARATLRSRQQASVQREPFSTVLLIGRPALGKRSLAVAFGQSLFGALYAVSIDLAHGPVALKQVRDALRWTSQRVLVLENPDKADAALRAALLEMVKEGRLTEPGGIIDARSAILILVVHQDGGDVKTAIDEGLSIVIPTVARQSELSQELVSRLDAWIAVLLPSDGALLQCVKALFKREASAHGLEIEVDRHVLSNEVKAITDIGDFSIAPGRIRSRAGPAIQKAIAAGARKAIVEQPPGAQT